MTKPKPCYVFPGLRPFIDKAAKSAGHKFDHLDRDLRLWHCSQVQNALGQYPTIRDPASQVSLMEGVRQIHKELGIVLEGIRIAIETVEQACDFPSSKPIKKGDK